jgi:hypothetical protein
MMAAFLYRLLLPFADMLEVVNLFDKIYSALRMFLLWYATKLIIRVLYVEETRSFKSQATLLCTQLKAIITNSVNMILPFVFAHQVYR